MTPPLEFRAAVLAAVGAPLTVEHVTMAPSGAIVTGSDRERRTDRGEDRGRNFSGGVTAPSAGSAARRRARGT